MIKKAIRLFNCLILNNIKFFLIKIFHINSFKYNFINLISPFCTIDIQDNGKIIFGKKCNILSNNVIGVRENGILNISDGVYVNQNCHIISHKKISIGKNVCIGPNTIIMDHDHVITSNGVNKKKFISKDIIIEDGVWIGANCTILKGAIIRKNSVIAAGSIVTSEVLENKILIQKRVNELKNI